VVKTWMTLSNWMWIWHDDVVVHVVVVVVVDLMDVLLLLLLVHAPRLPVRDLIFVAMIVVLV